MTLTLTVKGTIEITLDGPDGYSETWAIDAKHTDIDDDETPWALAYTVTHLLKDLGATRSSGVKPTDAQASESSTAPPPDFSDYEMDEAR